MRQPDSERDLYMLQQVNIFISSPGDVQEERKIALHVIDRLNRMQSIATRYVLKPLAFEDIVPPVVGHRPQTTIDRYMREPGKSDILICILWHRMGKPFVHEKTLEQFQSGTEYEFVDAYRAYQKSGKPYILLYRAMKPLPSDIDPEQLRQVQNFFSRFEGEFAELKGLYKTYQSNEEFGNILFYDLERIILQNPIGRYDPGTSSLQEREPVRQHPYYEELVEEPRPPKRGVSRRIVLMCLVGLAATGGLTWLALSQKPRTSSFFSPPATASSPANAIPSTIVTPLAPTPPIPSGKLFLTYRGHSNLVNDVAWSPTGTRIASASFDFTVHLWDARSGANLLTYRGHSFKVRAVAWSPDGTRIVSASDDTTAQVWDATTGHPLYTYRGHSNGVFDVAWSLDGTRIASASGDHTVQVWEAASGAHLFTYTGHFDRVRRLVWSPDGTRIASGSDDTTVQVWDAATGAHAMTYRGHVRPLNALAWSPDGTRIASGSWDTTVQVWDAATTNHIFTYAGHTLDVWAMAWSPNGTYIVSGGRDKTAQVWKVASGEHVSTYFGHHNVVTALAWSPDSRLIVSGGGDNTAQVWEPV